MICLACNGDQFRRKLVPHPGIPGKMVTVTSVCKFCQGKGHVKYYQPCGLDRAAQSREEENEDRL